MKIAYIWFDMERFDEGVSFNLGSKYRFYYEKSTSKLFCEDNNYYIKNFFNTNEVQLPIELNAIVGANGVGKTSILNKVRSIILGEKRSRYILIIENEKIYEVYTNFKITIEKKKDVHIRKKLNTDIFNTIYFSNVIDVGFFW